MTAAELAELEGYLTDAERAELDALVAADLEQHLWYPLPGPQTTAFNNRADIIGFGGAAGGGKTDLACGKALEQHLKVMIMRREGTQLQGVLDRLTSLVGSRQGYNGQDRIWRDAGPRSVQIEFGSVPNLGDENKYQGRDHDLLVFDEAANFLEAQVRFLLGWVRSATAGVHSQALLTFNPPTNAEGRWVIDFFGPWLNKKHELYPAIPGQPLYAAMLPAANGTSKDVWTHNGEPLTGAPFVMVDGELVFDFDPADYKVEDIVYPRSRTFIPSRISDNPHLVGTGYMSQLQALPEPLRSQMLYGDFQAGVEDDVWQVIPTAWVERAQKLWREMPRRGEMLSLGCDVARGGKDNTVICTRHKTPETEHWYDKLQVTPGTGTPNGPMAAGLVVGASRDRTPQHIDVIGVGASVYDSLITADQPAIAVNVSERAPGTDLSGQLTFMNQRSWLWWRFRELLDPLNNHAVMLPPDQDLLAELCAPKWKLSGKEIQVESREDVVKRVGRSPDRATAVILASIETPKLHLLDRSAHNEAVLNYDPMRSMR